MVTVTAAATTPIASPALPTPTAPPTVPPASSSPAPDASAVAVVEGVVARESHQVQDTQRHCAPDPMPADPLPSDKSVTDPTPAQAAQNPPAPSSVTKQEKKSDAKVCISILLVREIAGQDHT